MQYFSTFNSGLKQPVERAIKTTVSDIKVSSLLDGLIEYSTLEETDTLVDKLRFTNNTFILVHKIKTSDLYTCFDWIEKHPYKDHIYRYLKQKYLTSFRVIVSEGNLMVHQEENIMNLLEKSLASTYEMQIDRSLPDTEFWIISRSELYIYIGLRITPYSSTEHREKGQIRSELANIMCMLSEPSENDIFLDPFSGKGTIPYERSCYPFKQVIQIEKKEHSNTKLTKHNVQTIIGDFFAVDIKENSIDKIVTDPPWGIFDRNLDIDSFFPRMFSKFQIILKNDGLIVLLISRELSQAIEKYSSGFEVLSEYQVLTSGKKASLLVLRKNS